MISGIGEIAALSNAAVWATTGVVSKGLRREVRPLHIVTLQIWSAFLILTVAAAVFGQLGPLWRMPVSAAAVFAGSSVINTVGALTFWMAMSRGTVSRVYPTTQGLFILMSISAGALLLGDDLGAGVLIGAALIIAGVVLVNRRKRRQEDEASDRRAEAIALSLSAITALLWASAFAMTADALDESEPLPAAIIRNAVPAALLGLLALFVPHIRVTRVFRPSWRRLLVIGALIAYLEYSFVLALDRASPSVAAVLINTSPMWATALALIVLRERLSKAAMIGVALSVAGIIAAIAL